MLLSRNLDLATNYARTERIMNILALVCFAYGIFLIIRAIKKICQKFKERKQLKRNRKWEKARKIEEKRERQKMAEYEYYKKHEAPKAYKEWQNQQKEIKPDPLKKFENNPDWYWDDKNNLWRYKGKK